MKSKYFLNTIFLILSINVFSQQHNQFIYNPHSYIAYKVLVPLIIDGKLNEEGWLNTDWTKDFIDIEGSIRANPFYKTRVKMLWDKNYLYIAAELEEEHIWATITEKDEVIFHDNDFEVFIDPDGDTHNYYELEINALGTIWDLLLTMPYRDKGIALNGWDLSGMKKGIGINGTLNNPTDIDSNWVVELALPWDIMKDAAPIRISPKGGDIWRINFSRVEWKTEIIDGSYTKMINPSTEKVYPEYNWVWSPQGAIAMHQPETWGFVQFSNSPPGSKEAFKNDPGDLIKWTLRKVYYAQKEYYKSNGKYTDSFDKLKVSSDLPVNISITNSLFEASIESRNNTYRILNNGKIEKIK